jgi:hypothetical protein
MSNQTCGTSPALNQNRPKLTLTHAEKIERFEAIKMRNFANSSRLEGIEIPESDLSLDELVKKYTAAGKSQHAR